MLSAVRFCCKIPLMCAGTAVLLLLLLLLLDLVTTTHAVQLQSCPELQ
jgi:hypothetical protein